MGEDKKTPVTINDKEYILEALGEQEQVIINHIRDLDRKIANTKFNLDQLNVGREAFFSMLTGKLDAVDTSETVSD
jgi:hypothetical protein